MSLENNRFRMANTLLLKTAINKLTQARGPDIAILYFDYQLSKVRRKFGNQVLSICLTVLLSQAAGSVFSGNLSAFDIISSKECEIAGSNIVTIGNEESCLWQQHNFKPKTLSAKC